MKHNTLISSFKCAFRGIWDGFVKERNLKIHFCIMLLVIIFGIALKISKIEWLICIVWFAIVIGGELFNTAIETVVDIAMPNKNEKARIAKDVSAGAVLVLAIGAAVCGLIIFIPKLVSHF